VTERLDEGAEKSMKTGRRIREGYYLSQIFVNYRGSVLSRNLLKLLETSKLGKNNSHCEI
jgi:hypothetical protein